MNVFNSMFCLFNSVFCLLNKRDKHIKCYTHIYKLKIEGDEEAIGKPRDKEYSMRCYTIIKKCLLEYRTELL